MMSIWFKLRNEKQFPFYKITNIYYTYRRNRNGTTDRPLHVALGIKYEKIYENKQNVERTQMYNRQPEIFNKTNV